MKQTESTEGAAGSPTRVVAEENPYLQRVASEQEHLERRVATERLGPTTKKPRRLQRLPRKRQKESSAATGDMLRRLLRRCWQQVLLRQ